LAPEPATCISAKANLRRRFVTAPNSQEKSPR
jgi:hypothetical protein